MLRKKLFVLVPGIALLILSACAMVAQPTATPTLDAAATQAFADTAAANTKATADMLNTLATRNAKATLDAQSTADKQATDEAIAKAQTQDAANVTATAVAQATAAAANVTGTASAKETQTANKTATAIAKATDFAVKSTESAAGMYAQIQLLNEDGFLDTTEGTYHKIPDFDEMWAQLGWYMWWPTKYSPENFVIRADASWDAAYDRVNTSDSGCGFVFHVKDVDNHIFVFLAMDGYVYMHRFKGGVWAPLGSGYYKRFEVPADSAQIMLVAEDGLYTFFVNGEKVHSREDATLSKGDLALTLASGTNKDWGTRCIMKNIELWELP